MFESPSISGKTADGLFVCGVLSLPKHFPHVVVVRFKGAKHWPCSRSALEAVSTFLWRHKCVDEAMVPGILGRDSANKRHLMFGPELAGQIATSFSNRRDFHLWIT